MTSSGSRFAVNSDLKFSIVFFLLLDRGVGMQRLKVKVKEGAGGVQTVRDNHLFCGLVGTARV